ncbi:hypothetical protein VD659_01845 [Herbiconiux sp. 11R-BC]|uniref:hypothetical protein n=1 Tax=Herbiconiux sp. 11R-BC TaxID=3111637 RepID=UPI003C0753AD
MHLIHYAGRSFLSGTAIAEALLHYAQALARAGDAAIVEVPVVTETGSRVGASFLIGPASQLVIEPVDAGTGPAVAEPVDDALVERLGMLARTPSNTARPVVAERPGYPDPL